MEVIGTDRQIYDLSRSKAWIAECNKPRWNKRVVFFNVTNMNSKSCTDLTCAPNLQGNMV